jgi:replicative DNA helicase
VSDLATNLELPQSDEAERSVLGAILVDSKHLDEIADILRPEDFYRAAHQRLYRSMVDMWEAAEPIDILTLGARHQGDSVIEAVGGPVYISRLMDGIPRLINARHYALIVRERSVRRQLVRTASELVQQATLGEMGVEQMLGDAERRIFAIAEQRRAFEFRSMRELLEDSLDRIEARQRAGAGTLTGVPTGFAQFDELTSGLQPGDLIIVAARPAMGKTSWALSAAQNAAVRHQKKVAIFSLEMAAVQLAIRMLCSEARVDAQRLRRGDLTDRHWGKLIQAFGRLNEATIFIDDTTGITVSEMRAKARRLRADRGLDLVIVDYLQLMGSSGRVENRQQEISAISRSLKEMARELNVPVMALSQLSRAPDQRTGDHRPQLSDLRESGCLAGETLVTLPDLGARVPVRDLVGREGFRVLALDEEAARLEPAVVSRAFQTGVRPVFALRTGGGRTLRATANHRFRTVHRWRRLDALMVGERLAVHEMPSEALAGAASGHPAEVRAPGSWRAPGGAATQVDRAAASVTWDEIVAIEPAGISDVYDLTVPGPHSFVANDVVVHNSLEQDADVVAFIFREEVYRVREKKDPGDKKGIAEIIIGKQRNGPTDTVELAFIKEWTRFENLERQRGEAAAASPPPMEPVESGAEDRAPF